MNPLFPTVLAMLLITTTLAGCLHESNDEEPEEPDGTLVFDDLRECRGEYPPQRDTPIRCENEFDELDPEAGFHLEGWDCVGQTGMAAERNWAALYRNETGETHSLFYNTTARIAVSGIIAVEGENGTDYFVWNHGQPNATVDLEPIRPGDNLTVFIFVNILTSDRDELDNGTFSVAWSNHNERPYPVRVLETPDGEFYFQQTFYREDRQTLPYTWGVGAMELQGEDFEVAVMALDLVDATLEVPSGPDADSGPGPGC